jgi:hypothetical protein
MKATEQLLEALRENLGYIPCTCPYPRVKYGIDGNGHGPDCASAKCRAAIDRAESEKVTA